MFLLLGAWVCQVQSPTFDEAAHLPAGLYSLNTGRFDLYGNNPPLAKVLAAIPAAAAGVRLPEWAGQNRWRYAFDFQALNADRYHRVFFLGRLAILALGAVLGWFVFRWSRELWGSGGGLVSLLLYSFSPTILAHATLVTPDLCLSLFSFLTVFFFWRRVGTRSTRALVAAGVCFGLALLSKFSAFILVPALVLIALQPAPAQGRWGRLRDLLVLFPVGLLVLNAGYLFQGCLSPLGSLAPASGFLRSLPGALRLPVPADWLRGLDQQLFSNAQAVPAYFLGRRFADGKALWYYEPAAFLLKTSLPVLVLAACGVIAAARGRKQILPALLVPVLLQFLLVSLVVEQKIGLRYLLPVYPFLFVVAGGAVRLLPGGRAWRTAALAALLAFHCGSSLAAAPHPLAYFNELIGRNRNGYRYLVDSNLDWGQDLPALGRFLKERGVAEVGLSYFGTVDPGLYGIRYRMITEDRPATGWYAVSATHFVDAYDRGRFRLQNVLRGMADYRWLAAYEPVAVVGNSILVFHVELGD